MTRYGLKDLGGVLKEIEGDNDRAAIIVGASMVDHILESLIERVLPPLSKDDRDKIFTDNGLLGSFSAKIMWAYTAALIGPKTRHSLDMIRQIRNETAHNPNPISFDDGSIKGRSLSIEFSEKETKPGDARARFTGAINLLSLGLMARILAEGDSPELVARLLE
jgi:hypothetical protein